MYGLLNLLIYLIFTLGQGGAQQLVSTDTLHGTQLGCHRRMHTYRVSQTDKNNRECWDFVSVAVCWGRCDSGEISDWKFPFKRSYHPVCVHAARQPTVTILRNCHPEVDEITKRYEYLEAVSCHCHTCSSSDTNCEAPIGNVLQEGPTEKLLALAGTDSLSLDYD